MLLGSGFSLTPAAGLTWTKTDLDDVAIATGSGTPVTGRISSGSDDALVGRIGTQISYHYQINDVAYLTPFASYTYWRNFENDADLTLTFDDPAGGSATTIAGVTNGVEAFSQYSLGVAVGSTSGPVPMSRAAGAMARSSMAALSRPVAA